MLEKNSHMKVHQYMLSILTKIAITKLSEPFWNIKDFSLVLNGSFGSLSIGISVLALAHIFCLLNIYVQNYFEDTKFPGKTDNKFWSIHIQISTNFKKFMFKQFRTFHPFLNESVALLFWRNNMIRQVGLVCKVSGFASGQTMWHNKRIPIKVYSILRGFSWTN